MSTKGYITKICKYIFCKINNTVYYINLIKWYIDQIYLPRPVGTIFKKKVYKFSGTYEVTYEIVAHATYGSNLELVEEIGRIKL